MTTWFCVHTEATPGTWGAEPSADDTVGETGSAKHVSGWREIMRWAADQGRAGGGDDIGKSVKAAPGSGSGGGSGSAKWLYLCFFLLQPPPCFLTGQPAALDAPEE